MGESEFEGHSPRRCGDHRTVGIHRAWCHSCGEWCYPDDGCSGCKPDVDDLMEEVAKLRAENAELRAALDLERSRRTLGGTPPPPDENWANRALGTPAPGAEGAAND